MSKKIIIDTCEACPHRTHKGGFGMPAYIPICSLVPYIDLPYTQYSVNRISYAKPTYEIPDWCLLDNDKD